MRRCRSVAPIFTSPEIAQIISRASACAIYAGGAMAGFFLSLPGSLRNPFNPQSLISHLTNSNGCGIFRQGCADSVPVSSLFPPQPRVFSQPSLALQPNFYAPGASSSPSMICRLFVSLCSLFHTRVLCFHQLAASFSKMPGGVGTSAEPLRTLRLFTLLAPIFERSLEGRVIIFLCFCRPGS
jgi:hypothetical protein